MSFYEEQMASYAAFHTHPKNRLTHFFGIPLVLFSTFLFLTLVRFPIGERELSLAWVLLLALAVYYLYVRFLLGMVLTVYCLLCVTVSQWLWLEHKTTFWWFAGVTMVLGWSLQFLGHYFEGKRPAFFSNIYQLLNGPLFIAHELFSRK